MYLESPCGPDLPGWALGVIIALVILLIIAVMIIIVLSCIIWSNQGKICTLVASRVLLVACIIRLAD